MAMTKQSKLDEAVKHFNKALEAKPVRPEVHYGLAGAFYQQGKLNRAAQQCAEALRVRPDYLAARITLAGILVEMGETQLAVEHYHKALQLEPDQAHVLKNLAWILATSKDVKLQNPNGVVKLAVRACELTEYNQPEFLDTLAAAYAAAGRFSQAIQTAEKAINLAENTGMTDLAERIRKRLELYQAGQPYFEN
jgi:serine/threonine-protein kinase